jgi:hypothetical protein
VIQKQYTQANGASYVRHLVDIYSLLEQKNVPNVDQLEQYFIDDADHGSAVCLVPKGIDSFPRRPNEVSDAVICILEALVVYISTRQPNEIHKLTNSVGHACSSESGVSP